jgi:hypothetical protein
MSRGYYHTFFSDIFGEIFTVSVGNIITCLFLIFMLVVVGVLTCYVWVPILIIWAIYALAKRIKNRPKTDPKVKVLRKKFRQIQSRQERLTKKQLKERIVRWRGECEL